MKYLILVLSFVLIPLMAMSQKTNNKKPHEDLLASINSAGREISSDEGSVSYSIGQVFYSSYEGTENYVIEGVQQPEVIYVDPFVSEKKNHFRVAAYPNPVTDYFTIEASTYTNRSLDYHLMDLQGRLIKEDRIGKSGATVNIASLPVAIYLLRISDNGKFIKTIKIIKK